GRGRRAIVTPRPISIVIQVLDNTIFNPYDASCRQSVTGKRCTGNMRIERIGADGHAFVDNVLSDLVCSRRTGEERTPLVRCARIQRARDALYEIPDCRRLE